MCLGVDCGGGWIGLGCRRTLRFECLSCHRLVSQAAASCPCCRRDTEADWARLDNWEGQQPLAAPAALLIGGGSVTGAAVQ
eukprot:2686804-Alexandrium_andersonii.AAC.1